MAPLDASGVTICPEEVLRNTVLEVGIQRGEPNKMQSVDVLRAL